MYENLPNLTILVGGGRETNMDFLSNGEWKESSLIYKSIINNFLTGSFILWMAFDGNNLNQIWDHGGMFARMLPTQKLTSTILQSSALW